MQSPALSRYFAPSPVVSAYYQRYREILIRASGSKYVAEHAFTELMSLETDLIFDELNRGFRCIGISELTVPQGILNLQRLINEQVQNPVLFNWLFCAVQTGLTRPIFQNDRSAPSGYQTNVPLVRQVIPEIRQLSTGPSAFGDVWRTLIMGNAEIALLKTYRAGYDNDHIAHEFFIAHQLNKLRADIPNFVYGYGMFRCQSPYSTEDGIPRACPIPPMLWEDEPRIDERNYLIMEYVKPGIPLLNIVGRLSFEQVMMVYFQVISACAVAYDRMKFTHYDLHMANVILQSTNGNEEIFIPYTFEDRTIYIRTRVIAKILDYGTSYVEVPDKIQGIPTGQVMKFGNFQMSGIHGRRATEPNPFHDIYMFSGTLLKALIHEREEDPLVDVKPNLNLFWSVHHIITRFPAFSRVKDYPDSDAFKDVINSEINDNFAHSRVKDIPAASVRAFSYQIDHILQHYPQLRRNVIFIMGQDLLPMGAKILACDHADCSNWNQIQELVRRQ